MTLPVKGAGDPDRRERELKITSLDIRRKEFKRSFRGYSDEEVDIFLDEVADELERLLQGNAELQERVQSLEEQLAAHNNLREALERTLVQAQLQADDVRANARKESELILRDAQMKARGIINDSYVETQKIQRTLAQLKSLEEEFRFKFRSLLEGYLKLLNQAELTVSEPAVASEAVAEEGPVAELAPDAGATAAAAERPSTANADEVPTEEATFSAEAAFAEETTSTEEMTLEDEFSVEGELQSGKDAEPEVETFFIGKQADYSELIPNKEDAGKKGQGRDFEW